jgi:hypothetical protein
MAKEKEVVVTSQGVPLPKGVKLQDLIDNWNTAESEYQSSRTRMKVLDLADRGRIWELIAQKFPEYQITPDTNYTNYVKENIVASVYTVGRAASLLARAAKDVVTVEGLNKVLDTLWGVLDVPSYQLKAGERAALLNLGITQVGWNNDIVGGTDSSWYKGDVVFKNIDPMNYMRDPYANSLDDAAYVMFFDKYHKSILMGDPDYAKALKDHNLESISDASGYSREIGNNAGADKNYFRLIVHWMKVYDEEKEEVVIHEIHTIDNKFVLFVKEDIEPRVFPFAELYSSIAVKDPIGISEPAKILSSSIVLNLLDGLTVTHAYKAQRPPRLISDSSGLNLRAFAQHGNDPDKAFIVRGNAQNAVQYVAFPPLPQNIENLALRVAGAMERMSGIDAKYTGKDTGSILTTGGIDSMLAQATMRDTTRIKLYEDYSRRLTRLVIQYLIKYGDKRSYAVKEKNSTQMFEYEVDFPNISNDILFNYSINIDAETPKNKARLAAAADAIMEKSMQYQSNPEIMTIEEWLMYQDFPQKDLILERLKGDRTNNITEQVAQIISMFATMVESGIDPNQAINNVVQALQEQQQNPGATPQGPSSSGGAPGQPPAPGGQRMM